MGSGSCPQYCRTFFGKKSLVKRYLFQHLNVTVSHDLNNMGDWSPCLQVKDVTLPTGYFFGASAVTGKYFKHIVWEGEFEVVGGKAVRIPGALHLVSWTIENKIHQCQTKHILHGCSLQGTHIILWL